MGKIVHTVFTYAEIKECAKMYDELLGCRLVSIVNSPETEQVIIGRYGTNRAALRKLLAGKQ